MDSRAVVLGLRERMGDFPGNANSMELIPCVMPSNATVWRRICRSPDVKKQGAPLERGSFRTGTGGLAGGLGPAQRACIREAVGPDSPADAWQADRRA